MIVIVDYTDEKYGEEARRIANKLCEGDKRAFVDLSARIGKNAVPSFEFLMLKRFLDTEAQDLGKDAVLDGRALRSILSKLDSLQEDFIRRLLDAAGAVSIEVSNTEEKPIERHLSKTAVKHFVDKEFFIDLEQKFSAAEKKIKEDPLYKVLNGIRAHGFYIGPGTSENTVFKMVALPGSAGHKITYEEYADWFVKNVPLKKIEDDGIVSPDVDSSFKLVFVRQHHPAELLAKKIAKK